MLLVTFVRERERRARIHTLSGGICLSFSLSLSLSVAPSITHTHTCSHADVLKTKMMIYLRAQGIRRDTQSNTIFSANLISKTTYLRARGTEAVPAGGTSREQM